MSTLQQTAANQLNAQSSTGPRTDAGKAASSQNSTCHGLSSEFTVLSHENPAEFNQLFNDCVNEFQPNGIHEEFLVRRMVEARWQSARAQRLEQAAFEAMLDSDAAALSPDARIVSKMQGRGDILTLLQRYSNAATAQYDKAYRELIRGRKERFKEEQKTLNEYIRKVVFAPMPGEQTEPPPPIGFVSQNAPLPVKNGSPPPDPHTVNNVQRHPLDIRLQTKDH